MYFVLTDLEWFDRQRGEKYIDVTWWIWLMHFSPSALAAVACTPLPCQVAERCFWLSLEATLEVLGMSPRKGYCRNGYSRRHRKIQDPFTIVCRLPSFRMKLHWNLLGSRIRQHSCQAQGWFVLMSNHRRLGVEIHSELLSLSLQSFSRTEVMSWGRPLAVGYYALVEISELKGEFACLICWLFSMVETS